VPASRSRKSIRLTDYDYASPGAYFVTICTHERRLLFEDPLLATILEEEWQHLPQRFATVGLDAFVVMPNHLHFVIWLKPASVAVGLAPVSTPTGAPARGAPYAW
jgi:REP element-mobilizing transposase RayT